MFIISSIYHTRSPSWEVLSGLDPNGTSQSSFLQFIYLCINLFWAVLGLPCCTQAFSGCGERGLLCCHAWASHCSGFSCYRAQGLGQAGSVATAYRLGCPEGHGILIPGHRIKPVSPTSAVSFLTTEPPGKSPSQSPCCS